ncbi:hypothetical protein D1159_03830 [Pseudoflavonifractor sp. 524-17]|uniref:phage scaffolding protein n=1 Tax=Pseudoflavonifractor sp. 524-17 TaxID=2304577 RepID=UPI00137B1210|nr:hypothetical protein [Pseudoflavonifractor sp. 524-17]NCE63729.1 hypothetical protein [Pseudoflavonifractor sp. 524-17]
MPFTREFIRKAAKESGMELPKEFEDVLVQEHLSARDAYAAGQVKTALEENKQDPPPAVKDTQEYKDLKKEFEDFKAEQAKKDTRTAKETAYRAILKEAGVSEKRIEAVLRVSDVDGVELDDKGQIKGADKLSESIKTEWADFIPTTHTEGAPTATPPANTGGHTMTKEQIMDIKDIDERYKAMAEHSDLFGI